MTSTRELISGWYFPAIDELSQVYAGYSGLDVYPGLESDAPTVYKVARDKFNSVLVGNESVALSDNYYWSSSGDSSNSDYYGYGYAFGLNFNNGANSYSRYNETNSVRAVRAF